MIALILSTLNREEGFRSKPYLDMAGVPTIGYGSTFYENGTKVKMTDPAITKQRALELKEFVVNQFWNQVKGHIHHTLNDNRKAAIISLIYNIGPGAFLRSTLLKRINADPEDPSITEAFKMWRYARVEGELKPILLERRIREAALYFKKKTLNTSTC